VGYEAQTIGGELRLRQSRQQRVNLPFEWRRKAELSSDRAALVTDDECGMHSMKVAGGSVSLRTNVVWMGIRQSDRYQALELNQVYKFLLYNGGQGAMLSHPFPVERLHLQSEQYQRNIARFVR